MPRATFPASICPAGRQGQRRFLCRLHGRRSSALPFRPIGGAPGTAPLFLHPAARGTDAARPFPPMRTGGQSLPFSTFSRAPESCFFLYPAARPTIPRTVAEAMLAKGLVRGGFLRGFAGPPRRCFPLGSSEAASHGVFQRRHCAQRRRSLLSFSPPPPGERMPRARSRPCEPAGSPFPFPHFPTARSYFFLYPAVLPAIPRTVAAAMLPDGLVRGGFLRAFAGPPRRCFPLGSSEAAFCGVLKRRRCAQCRRTLLPFFPPPPGERMPRARSRPCEPAGSPFPFPHFPTARPYFFLYPAVLPTMPRATFPASICPAGRQGQRRFLCRLPGRRSSALPFRPIGGAPGAASLSSIPSRPDSGCRARSPPSPKPASEPFPFPILSDNARAHSRSREPAGSPFPFPHFPTARPYFFLYPAVLPTMPRATFPASFCPAGRQGQRRVLYHLPGWRSSALPFRPIGGAPGTAPLFLHPAARETDAARHFSCIHLSRRTAGTAPLSLPPARAAEQRAPFSPYRRRARRCISFFYTQPTGQRMPRAVAPFPQTGKRTLSLSHTFGQRARPFPFTRTGGLPLPFSTFSGQQACASGRRPRTAHSPCSCARLLPPHLSFDFRPALPSAQPTPVRASLPRRFLRFRAALFPAAARCIRPCSCAGGRIAPFFRLFPRAPRAFLALRPLCARPVRIASR